MRFRPANISLINRRHYLPRLLLTLSSFEKNDQRTLTGHYISFPGWRQTDQSHKNAIAVGWMSALACSRLLRITSNFL